MFTLLLGGVYSAYKHFSGLDPLKLDPRIAVLGVMGKNGTISEFLNKIPGIKEKLEVRSLKIDPASNLQRPTSKAAFNFLLIADSHNDSPNLQKAISRAKLANADLSFVIGLGDYTNVGTLSELKAAKAEFDAAGLRYFLVAGDHDLWDSRNSNLPADTNFKQVFGPLFQSFIFKNYLFLLLDNSDDYLGFGNIQLDWVTRELEKSKTAWVKGIFVFLHEPLYHPSSDHYMGKLDGSLKQQAQAMVFQLKSNGVKKVFAGDIHYFSEYEEPTTRLSMVTVGATVTDRNPQAPRYAVVTVFDDGLIRVDDVEIK